MRLLRKSTTQTELTDDQLVDQCRAGAPEAFGTLYDRHLPGCYAYAYRLLGNRTDAEDAAHDALARARGNRRDPDRVSGRSRSARRIRISSNAGVRDSSLRLRMTMGESRRFLSQPP